MSQAAINRASRDIYHVRLGCGCHRTTLVTGKSQFYCLKHDDWFDGIYIKRTDLESFETHGGRPAVKLTLVKGANNG